MRHRLDGPAEVAPDGSRSWFVAGKRHRLDGPAVVMADGQREWWVDGVRHRVDGPAIMMSDGTRVWCSHGTRVKWALPVALWQESATRESLGSINDPVQQRTAALALLPTLEPTLQRAAVADALADPDAELRLWGLRAAALMGLNERTNDAPSDGSAAAPAPTPQPKPRLR